MSRSSTSRILAFIATVALVLTVTSTPAGSEPSKVNGPLTASWWQWSISMPLSNHPLSDPPSADCSAHQSGKIWFLGGVFNASGAAKRFCTIPRGVALLIPAINADCSNVEPPDFFGEKPKDRKACVEAIRFTDPCKTPPQSPLAKCTFVVLDNKLVAISYVVSPDFHFSGPDNNVLFVPGPIDGKATSAGWWALIPPLTSGQHLLRFGGTFPDFGFTLDITYHLTVV